MALKNNDGYYKIENTYIDYNSNFINVGVTIYTSQEERGREKRNKPLILEFIKKAHIYLQECLDPIYQYIQTHKLDDDIKIENARSTDENFNAVYTDYIEKSNELSRFENKLLVDNININDLKFKKDWINFGLTQEMCTYVSKNFMNYRFYLDNTDNITRQEIYNLLKEKIDGWENC